MNVLIIERYPDIPGHSGRTKFTRAKLLDRTRDNRYLARKARWAIQAPHMATATRSVREHGRDAMTPDADTWICTECGLGWNNERSADECCEDDGLTGFDPSRNRLSYRLSYD